MYNENMKLFQNKNFYLVNGLLFFLIMGFRVNINFVLANYDCYVDESAEAGGDGSEEKPFQKIQVALDEADGDIIYVKKGKYKEDITVPTNGQIIGEDKQDTIIAGKITLGDDTVLENLSVEGYGGIFLGDEKSARIEDVLISGAKIGLKTEGGGTLKFLNSSIFDSGKGMYLQKGKDIEIRSSSISDNDEEGVDIRANVDGVIADNKIKNNGESGIEVITGGSELKIAGNALENNKASGIAIQYYKEDKKNGALNIYNNTITKNKDYGVNCKIPSGGSPGSSYWTESVKMGANKIFNNKDGEFADFCKFSEDVMANATMTEEEKKARLAQQIEEQKRLKIVATTKFEQDERVKLEKEQQAREKKLEKDRLKKIKLDKEKQVNFEKQLVEFNKKMKAGENLAQQIKNRSKIKTFFIGSDYEKLNQLASEILAYDEKIEQMEKLKNQIYSQDIQQDISQQISKIKEKREVLKKMVLLENEKFSLFGWLFN
jgi:hypothetical protein